MASAVRPKAGEDDDLRTVEMAIRALWAQYGPQKPKPAQLTARNVARDNAEADAYEAAKDRFWSVVFRLVVSDEWRTFFPAAAHEMIERARRIITARGGADRLDE